MLYRALFRAVFAKMDPEVAHERTIWALGKVGKCQATERALQLLFARRPRRLAPARHGERRSPFARPMRAIVGLAAGMDKQATAVEGLAALGFGFIEIGTVTAHPQPGNDKPRLFRVLKQRAIVNRMGFNNEGAEVVARRLAALRATKRGRSIIVGANIGKSKVTPLSEAVGDYTYSARLLARWVDYLVVNVSSPNTPGLRDLQAVESLRPILTAVTQAADAAAGRRVPLFVKIAPDLDGTDIDAVASLVRELDLAGVVATNTTIDHHHETGGGGLSGLPLREKSLGVVRRLRTSLGPDKAIIGVGGISSIADAEAMLAAGADLLQAYTAFIYQGPAWPGRLNRALAERGYLPL
ncbi:quinone-dependent dihydroorotate dehydrogenase [Buchananella hordeovulneris]|uniref:Dihydroorotate dehydrogenase (quinone) n=1 Tax=Buchananella hordeovulneris TaxID=52770 RepID=A0A1Q5PTV4_9ACTO|nr:quinone-dependent dihydroorotate dehydrogenase [Buchananella hordeovulneris]OKL50956.1 dihydroorotate dehydrogenase (quinone) [Buchananella hordeovulneris]RRD44163.1 quinone-dependent dihydroorotate dehydrogenase [Buchananella hordeovulneris]RRD51619.1 quinone-dependent dihydroorotate dehydrogenase [Buchananella hordeovulneris]